MLRNGKRHKHKEKENSTCGSIMDWLRRESCVGASGFCRTGRSESEPQSGAMVTLGNPEKNKEYKITHNNTLELLLTGQL
jgi:hypothetical protein